MIDLYKGDCLEVMDRLIEQGVVVDAIITDPPYNIAKDNNFHTMGRQGIDFGEWDKDADLLSWIEKGVKLLSKNGSMIIFNAWKNLGDIARYAESQGMVIKDMLRWEKSNPMPRNRDRRYITDYECAVWLTNRKAKWTFNRQDKNYQRPLFKGSLTPKSEKVGHTTQKPEYLMEEIIKIHTNENDLILDCFLGSGTTGVAAKNLNRNFLGIEMDDNYFEIAKERIEKAYDDKGLFDG